MSWSKKEVELCTGLLRDTGYNVKVWPDGTWVGEDDWETIPEDYSDDYFVLSIPADVDDIDEYVHDHPQTFGKPKFKRLIAKTQIAPSKFSAEIRLIEMKSEPGYVSGYMIGFIGDDDYSVVGLYDHGDALVGDHKEVFVLEV